MENNITIRPLRLEDNKPLAKVIRTVMAEFGINRPGTVYYDPTTDDLFTLFQTPLSTYFVVEMDGEIVGGAGVYPTPNLPEGWCELVKLYLLPNTRGKGLGRLLIEKCFDAAKVMGYTNIYLESMPELNTALGLYEKLGFTCLPGQLGSSGHFGCDIFMAKEL